VILVALSLGIAILLGEIFLQVYIKVRYHAWLWNNAQFRISYAVPVEDRRQYGLRPDYSDQSAGLRIDQFGFRKMPSPGDNDGIIVCAGDSVPFGYGVKDDETYSVYLGQFLNAGGWRIGVVNAGIPSYNLRQSFDRVRKDVIPRFKLDRVRVLTIEAANDISLLAYYKEDWNPDRTWMDVKYTMKPQLLKIATLYYVSSYVDRISKFSRKVLGGQTETREFYKIEDMLDNIRRVLREELRFYRDQGIPVVLMPINPFYYQTIGDEKNLTLGNWYKLKRYVDEWADLINKFNRVIMETTTEFSNAYFFDTRRVMDSQDRNFMYIDYLHLSARGNQVRASSLLDFLIEHHLLSDKRNSVVSRR
jgi:lysophospholipase L1-like esterase